MTTARLRSLEDFDSGPILPGWVHASRSQTPEDAAFLSGAMLAHLHMVQARDDVPHRLWRDRLALRAAEAGVALSGRSEGASELRDAVHLLRPGDLPGPAGDIYLTWRRAVDRAVSVTALHRAVPKLEAGQIAAWLEAGQGGPVARAALVLETVLSAAPRAETAALILADAALAQGLGWRYLVPLLSWGIKRRDLRLSGDEMRWACHRAVMAAGPEAARLALDLGHRATHLKAVTPKLRAKGAAQGVEMFLTQDAVAPAALTALMSDRAARRFCERLVDLGAVHELTGRDTFRLYGV